MTTIDTPQAFVRALKAPSDPPSHGGPHKIEISRQVWDDPSFLVPNKAEVIADWILGKFLKEKDKEIAVNPLLDLRFWTLLHDVISSTNTGGSSWTQTRPLKTWLPPLLSRVPFAPSVVALLSCLGRLDSTLRDSVVPVMFSALEILWPVSAQKMNTEAILECFGAFLMAYYEAQGADNLVRIGTLIVASYRNSMSYSSNKKKIYSVFLRTYLPYWLKLHVLSNSETALSDIIYDAGIETLFNLDILRRIRDSKAENELLESIAPVLRSNAEVHSVLPRLFASYIESLKKHRGALVSQSSSQIPGSANAEIQTQGMQFLAGCLSLLDLHEHSAKTWSARVALVKVVDKENLFDRGNPEAAMVFDSVIRHALESLDIRTAINVLADYGIECLSTLARIDYDMVVPLVPQVLPKLLLISQMPVHTSYLDFLDVVLAYHNKTRTVNTYIEGLLNALSTIDTASLKGSPIEFYQSALSSPLFNATHFQRLSKALQAFLSGSQISALAQVTFGFLKQNWEKFDVEDDTEERSPKRRKTLNMGSTGLSESQRDCSAAVFSLSSHLAMTVFSSLPLHVVTKELREKLRSLLNDIRKFAARVVKKAMKPLTRSDQTSWPNSIVSAASLRLWYALDVSGNVTPAPFEDEKLYKRALKASKDEHMLPELLLELLKRLVRIIMSIGVADNPHSVSGLQAETLLLQVLHSAQFWELHKLRSMSLPYLDAFLSTKFAVVFLQHVEQTVSTVDDISMTDSAVEAIGAYRLLSILPLEYLSRTNRADFARRALALDRHISSSAMTPISKSEHLTVLRTFLSRVEQFCDALKHLMTSATSPTSIKQTLQTATGSVIESIFLYVLGIPFPSDIDISPAKLSRNYNIPLATGYWI
ncbi:hypothetical protein C0992_007204 [Termitomyces sp. T32_za158]|nr:hypothetical protein C0992_007204 [Termitomyces sp. T32_za158]